MAGDRRSPRRRRASGAARPLRLGRVPARRGGDHARELARRLHVLQVPRGRRGHARLLERGGELGEHQRCRSRDRSRGAPRASPRRAAGATPRRAGRGASRRPRRARRGLPRAPSLLRGGLEPRAAPRARAPRFTLRVAVFGSSPSWMCQHLHALRERAASRRPRARAPRAARAPRRDRPSPYSGTHDEATFSPPCRRAARRSQSSFTSAGSPSTPPRPRRGRRSRRWHRR